MARPSTPLGATWWQGEGVGSLGPCLKDGGVPGSHPRGPKFTSYKCQMAHILEAQEFAALWQLPSLGQEPCDLTAQRGQDGHWAEPSSRPETQDRCGLFPTVVELVPWSRLCSSVRLPLCNHGSLGLGLPASRPWVLLLPAASPSSCQWVQQI